MENISCLSDNAVMSVVVLLRKGEKSPIKGHFVKKNFKRAKVGKICWGLMILYCTIKTRMIYLCVAGLSKARNWRIFVQKK